MWSDRILLSIFDRFPPESTIFVAPDGRAEHEYESEPPAREFSRWFGLAPAELFAGNDVLDLGCGYGGKAIRYLEHGAASVTGVEISDEVVAGARLFAEQRGVGDRARFVVGTGESIPLADEQFDLVTMDDVMEHVVSPGEVLDECRRVLRPGGRLALVFPPYYDVTGGSHLHGYATRVPGLNLVFSTRSLKSATRELFERDGIDYRRWLRDEPTDKLWNMNGLTVRGFERLIAERDFEVEAQILYGHGDRRTPFTGELPLPRPVRATLERAAGAPLLREALCLRVCALLRK